jgi:hypothetical protein
MSERVYLSRCHHAYFAVEHGSGGIGAARRPWRVLDQPATTSGGPTADDEEQPPKHPVPLPGISNCAAGPTPTAARTVPVASPFPNHSPLRTVPTSRGARLGPWSVLPSGRASRSGKAGRFWSDRSGTGYISTSRCDERAARRREPQVGSTSVSEMSRSTSSPHALPIPPTGYGGPAVVGERNVGRV